MTRVFAIVLGAALALGSLQVRADPPPDPNPKPKRADIERARQMFDNGATLYAEGSYVAAIEAFRRAFQLSGEPNCLFNIALAYDRLDAFDDAIEYLQYYRAYAPKKDHPAIEKRIESFKTRKEKAEQAAREEAERAAQERAAAPKPVVVVPVEPTTPIFGPPAIAGTAVAAVGFAVGAGLGIASLRRKDDAASRCGLDADGDRYCPAAAESALRSHRRLAIGADVAFAIGAVGAITAIVWVVVAARKRKQERVSAAPGAIAVRF